ncbi:leucine-rich repeat-containing protein 4B-like [Ptychodera flava]|uniref:leucine-rich repeat-containing protein 4B-like n=1 Tax=Ptychodera flava TaxID=63121 RepID=UPI00396A693F
MDSVKRSAILLSCLLCVLAPSVRGRCIPATDVTCAKNCKCEYCSNQRTFDGLKCDCSFNDFSVVPRDVPTNTTFLKLLKNSIARLRNSEFLSLGILERLDLSHNFLDSNEIDGNAFVGLEKLRIQSLEFNRALKAISGEWFRPLKNLWKLDLESASVEIISEDAFRFLGKLTYLILRDNRIKKIEPSLFRDLSSLQKVLLQVNQLKTLPPDMFNGSKSIDELNVASNKLITILPASGLQNMENLKRLSVYQNPLDCGCDLVWFRQWIDTNDVIVKPHNTTCASGVNLMKFSPNDLQCEFPVVMVTSVSLIGFIAVCAAMVVIFNNIWRIR